MANIQSRWFYWFFAISMGVSLTVAFIFLPETRFSRPPMALSGQVVFTDDFGHTHILSNEEARQRLGALETDTETPQPKRTFIQELKPWSEISPNAFHVWIGGYRKILQTCTSPAVIYALALSSISLGESSSCNPCIMVTLTDTSVLGIGIAITLIYSSVLVTDFHWSQSSVGLFNVSITILSTYRTIDHLHIFRLAPFPRLFWQCFTLAGAETRSTFGSQDAIMAFTNLNTFCCS